MAEYIERGALLKELEAFPHLKTMGSVVRSIPATDVVEAIRCKYCIFFEEGYCCRNDNNVTCEDYCSYGERKEQNNG